MLNSLYKEYINNTNLVKGNHIIKEILKIIKEEKEINVHNQNITNFIIITLYKRQFKHESNYNNKDIFYDTIIQIYENHPEIIVYLIKLDVFSEYGYYKDYFNIWKKICHIYNQFEKDTNKIYEKYNPLIKTIIEVIVTQRGFDLQHVDTHIKTLNISTNLTMFGIDSIINDDSKNRIMQLKVSINSVNNINSIYNKNNKSNILNISNPEINISKVGMWIPRENKKSNKEIFWFHDYNIKKKITCFDLLISYNKVNNNLCDPTVYTIDKKRFRIENSLLNVFIGTPQINMCNSNMKDISFNKVGSRFIHKNKKYLLNKPLSNDRLNTSTSIKNMFKNNLFFYKFDRIETRKNLINYFINKNNNYNASDKKQPKYINTNIENCQFVNDICELEIVIPVKHYLEFFFTCQ